MFYTDGAPAARRTLWRLFAIGVAGVNALYALMLAPLYILVSSNVDFMYTVLPSLLHMGLELCSVVAYFVAYAILIFAMYRCERATAFIGAYAGAVLFKYAANLLMSFFLDGVPVGPDLVLSLVSVGVYVLIDAVIAALILLVAHAVLHRVRSAHKIACRACDKLGRPTPSPRTYFFPLSGVLRLDPMQRISLGAALIMAGFKILARAISHTLTPAQWSIVDYLFDLVLNLAGGYLLMLLVLQHLDKKDN